MTSEKPRQIFGILKPLNSYTEVDIKESYVIDSSRLQTKAGWTPFDGMRVTGKVTEVVLNGEKVFDGENIKGQPRGMVTFPAS